MKGEDYNLSDALDLAHMLRDFPSSRRDPAPTVSEAVSIISEAIRRRGHNWITGQRALCLLTMANMPQRTKVVTKTCWQCRGTGASRYADKHGNCGVCHGTGSVPNDSYPTPPRQGKL